MFIRRTRWSISIIAIAAAAVSGLSGCSSWPWKSPNQDAERLTRVIHAENARLKDVVVQLRSSNEDMAQRALDDASRIARLEEENEDFRMSIAAYRTERERMARSFQSLQEQVRLALGDRTDILTTSFAGNRDDEAPSPLSPQIGSPMPPEGELRASDTELVLGLEDWFVPDTAILRDGIEPRLSRLGRWLSTRTAGNRPATCEFGTHSPDPRDRSESPSGIPQADGAELLRIRAEIDTLRARRLFDAILPHLTLESATRIRFMPPPNTTDRSNSSGTSAFLVIPLEKSLQAQ